MLNTASPRVHGRTSKMDTIENAKGIKGEHSGRLSNKERKDSKWEILTNLESGTTYSIKPKKLEGWLTKRRKWPLKGWHKRYFVLDRGLLTYGKTQAEINRGRTHGRIDVGLAVISAKTEVFRIDIDDEVCIHHLKASDIETFGLWLEQLQQHRFYRQNQINTSTPDEIGSPNSPSGYPSFSPRNSLTRGIRAPQGPGRPSALTQEFAAMDERMTDQLLAIQQHAVSLGLLAQKLEDDVNLSSSATKQGKHFSFGLRKKKSNGPLATSAPKSDSNSRSSTLTSLNQGAIEALDRSHSPINPPEDSSSIATMSSAMSSSNPSLASITPTNTVPRPISMPSSDSKSSQSSSSASKDEVIGLVTDLQSELTSLVRSYTADRDKLKAAISMQEEQILMQAKTSTLGSSSHQQAAPLRQALNQALQQNASLRAKLQKIHMDADVSDLPQIPSVGTGETLPRGGFGHPSLSYSSSCISEFFDAREYNTDDGAPSEYSSDDDYISEKEEEGGDSSSDDEIFEEAPLPRSISGDLFNSMETQAAAESNNKIKDVSKESAAAPIPPSASTLTRMTGRRQELPAMKADTSGVNLWNLLCKNIGKDLSKISMPVTLNEPLSVLQRLCEELEYSELLDRAATNPDAVERMTFVAAFVVSAYGYVTARAGHKPFNPLLGETFECIREDRGFKYVAEQVSHHPPVSSCHAIGKNWIWWQEFRVKTKFWGKSMEFQPEGVVKLQLTLPDGSKEEYSWNKITTCIHNLFSSGTDRWADLYGECMIQCKSSQDQKPLMSCRLEFLKSSGYWSSAKRHEVLGSIMDNKGKVLQNLFGICTEALYCGKAPSARCIWRPGALPDDAHLFYGFSRFAIELNEALESEKLYLPKTDTRFRPDQKCLEEGQIGEAEQLKLKLEQAQRERRAAMEERSEAHKPKWFEKNQKDQWTFNDKYWTERYEPGFSEIDLTELW